MRTTTNLLTFASTTSTAADQIPALRMAILVGSTREGRVGSGIARWFADRATEHASLELDVVDLARFAFPAHYPLRPTEAMQEFAARIEQADAFVVVTPEYNHGYPASLKQAIDVGCGEWFAKPVGFVSYGTHGQGLRSVEQLRLVFAALHMVTVADVVSFNLFDGSLDDDGSPRDADAADVAVHRMLAELIWWAHALREARTERPYVA